MTQTTNRQMRRMGRKTMRAPQGRKAAHGTEADNQAQGQCPDQGDEKQLKGLEKSAVQGRQHGPECAGGKKFNHGIVLSRSVW